MQSEKVGLVGGSPEPVQVRRGPLERYWRIHDVIASGKFPNCSTLAAQFEVSEKTVRRDLDYMRDHLELPIEYDAARHGFFYSKPVDGFGGGPKLTEAELFSFLVAHKAIAQYQGTPFHQPLQMAFAKLTRSLDQQERYCLDNMESVLSFRPFAPEDADADRFLAVSRALQERLVLSFDYRKPGQREAEERRAHPYHLTCCDNRWYLLAHDEGRNAVRTFALCRMARVSLTVQKFVKPIDFDPNKRLRGSWTVMAGDGDYNVVIEFDAWATDIMRGRHWHASQEVTELPDGGSRVRMRLSTVDEIERWALSWGTHAHVVEPKELRERVARTAQALAARYQ